MIIEINCYIDTDKVSILDKINGKEKYLRYCCLLA